MVAILVRPIDLDVWLVMSGPVSVIRRVRLLQYQFCDVICNLKPPVNTALTAFYPSGPGIKAWQLSVLGRFFIALPSFAALVLRDCFSCSVRYFCKHTISSTNQFQQRDINSSKLSAIRSIYALTEQTAPLKSLLRYARSPCPDGGIGRRASFRCW